MYKCVMYIIYMYVIYIHIAEACGMDEEAPGAHLDGCVCLRVFVCVCVSSSLCIFLSECAGLLIALQSYVYMSYLYLLAWYLVLVILSNSYVLLFHLVLPTYSYILIKICAGVSLTYLPAC